MAHKQIKAGRVYLVGTGPGDPDLMTLRAAAILGAADAVAVDTAVDPRIFDLVPETAERLSLAEDARQASLARLAEVARNGGIAACCKPGDAFVFGRMQEELTALVEAGAEVQAVSGICAAAGWGAAVGIPMTHRATARGVRFLELQPPDDGLPDWKGLADPETTLVIRGALDDLDRISRALITAGLDPETPAALLTQPAGQAVHCLRCSLDTLAATGDEAEVPPRVVVIGRTVALTEEFDGWLTHGSEDLKAHG